MQGSPPDGHQEIRTLFLPVEILRRAARWDGCLAVQGLRPSAAVCEVRSPARKALYDNLGQNAGLALAVDTAVLDSRQGDWRGNAMKI